MKIISEPSTRLLAFLGALAAIMVGSVLGHIVYGVLGALILDAVLLFAIFIMRAIFTPPWTGKPNARLVTLTIFAGIAASFGLYRSVLKGLVMWVFAQFGIPFPAQASPEEQILVLTIVGIVLVLLTWLFERNQILPLPQPKISEEDESFPKTDYKELRDRFCKYMVTVLNKIDEEVNWSDSEFTTLEAEIVMEQRGSSRPKLVPDLIEAIRKDHKASAFILIGDPGSGKSVSLRRLARVLYDTVPSTGIVPVYINLREWDGPREPTDSDIADFIYRYLLRISGRAGQAFLKNWYEKMLSYGLFFFLLDSFDEMPAVMDCDDRSPQLKKISEAFDRFLHDIHQCRGVLSSRPFRQPVGVRGRRLTIRPFTEAQIRKAMKNWLRGWNLDENVIIHKLFAERPELSPAIRNPFTADLIAQYVIDNPDKLPDNYFDLYNHYICKRLKEDVNNLDQLGLTSDQVLDAATKIAWTMYNTEDVGLEIDVPRLQRLITDERLSDKVAAMRFSRIARVGGVGNERFSFAHRRFAEFFAVRAIQKGDAKVDVNAIPSDSRWRDALVVYSGIAPQERIEGLANFSWGIIQEHGDELRNGKLQEAMPAVHCLRFLRDACQSRPESIHAFRTKLSQFIVQTIQNRDVLIAKIAAESLPLLTPVAQARGINVAFGRGIPWLSETALRSCRHLAHLDVDAIRGVRKFVRTLPTDSFLLSFRDLDFSLTLSDSLRSVRIALWLDLISLILLWLTLITITTITSSLLYPWLVLILAVLFETSMTFMLTSRGFRSGILGQMRFGFDSSLRIACVYGFFLLWLLQDVSSLPGEFRWSIPKGSEFGMFLVVPLIVAPWELWPYAFALVKRINALPTWLRHNFKRVAWEFVTSIGGSVLVVLFIGGVFTAYTQLVHVFPWLENVVHAVLAIAALLLATIVVAVLGRNTLKRLSDNNRLRQMNLEPIISWSTVCQIANSLVTDWGQARYFELLRTQRIEILDHRDGSPMPSYRGLKAVEQATRLREQILGLQE